MQIDTIASLVNGKVRGNEVTARCVAHDDKNPSMVITVDGDNLLWYCFSGCSQESVAEGLRARGILNQTREDKPHSYIKPAPSFAYTLEFGDGGSTHGYAMSIWKAGKDEHVALHPYAFKKGIRQPVHCRRGSASGSLIGQNADCLLVPQYDWRIDSTKLIGVECINAEGVKQTFGSKGLVFWGDMRETTQRIHLVEGYATGECLQRYLPNPSLVIACFSKARMEQVYKHFQCRSRLRNRTTVHHETNNRDFWDLSETERQEYVRAL